MSTKTYTIEIADATGHSVVQMTKTELISEASKAKGSWIFVDNKMVATDELANTDFDSAQHIRMVPALQAGSEDKMYTIEIADATGHSVVQMTKSDLIQQASNAKGSWVFVDNRMVAAAELADTDFDTAQHIRMVPALQAGQ